MTIEERFDLKRYRFRKLHPNISIRMASDRYAGWIGQVAMPLRSPNKSPKDCKNLNYIEKKTDIWGQNKIGRTE